MNISLYLNKMKKAPGIKSVGFLFRKFSSKNEASSTNLSYLHNVSNIPLVHRTIGQQLGITADIHGSKEALVSLHEGKRFTFAEIIDKADRLAAGFRELGLQKGDRLGILAPNTSTWYLSMMAAARCGLVSVGLNPAFQTPEVEYCLKKVGIKAIVAPEGFKTQNYYNIIKNIAPELDNAKPGMLNSKNVPKLSSVIIDTDKKLPGVLTFNELFSLSSETAADDIKMLQSTIDPDSPCNIQFTSGTTGTPKAALLSHFGIVNNSYFISKRFEFSSEARTSLLQMPFFHVFGVVIVITGSLHHGASIILPGPNFNAAQSIKALQTEKCSHIHGSPTMFVDLTQKIRDEKIHIENLKTAVTGGAPCSPALFNDIKTVLRLQNVKTVFGQTEGTAVAFETLPGDKDESIFNTVGHIQDHLEVKVIDKNGFCVPFGTPGELCIRGYPTMLGYFDDIEKTREVLDSTKWLKTGDKFVLNENGYGKIVGRLKDMIIRGGENIAPKEIEDFLNSHPDVLETHVIGVPDERMGEEVFAFVRLVDGKQLPYDEMKAFCKGQIAHFKIPRYLKVVENFPKTSSGKVQKYKLKEFV